jgi:hypothetical protein
MKRNTPYTLFPETVPIGVGRNHFRVIQLLLENLDGILQKDIVIKLKIDKTTVSEIKDDLIRLGWCTNKDLGITKEIHIVQRKIDEIKNYLGHWQRVGKCLFLRPHDIVINCTLIKTGDIRPEIFYALSAKYHVILSSMKHNLQCHCETPEGDIQLYQKGNKVKFYIREVIVPVNKEDIEIYEEHIVKEIYRRQNIVRNIIQDHLGKYKIKLSNVDYLKSLHLGLVTSENVAKVLKKNKLLKDLGMFQDNSIEGCKESEMKGNPHKAYTAMREILRATFEIEDKEQ